MGTTSTSAQSISRVGIYARRALWIMFAINFLNYMDRFILPSVISSIQKEFHFDDFAAGSLATAFTLVYAVTALPFGAWADRGIRKNVVAFGVGLWSIATFLTGLAGSFAALFVARAAVGVGEAGYYPAGTSLLIDYFPRERRSWMLGVWNVGASIGIAVGFALGGLIAERYGWRWAFYCTVIPGLICTFLAWRIHEPQRRHDSRVDAPHPEADPVPAIPELAPPFRVAMRRILRIPTMRVALIVQTLSFFVLGAAALWFPTLLQRRYGISEGSAGVISGGVLVLAGIAGTLGGAWLADRLMPRMPFARLLVTAAAFVVSAPLLLAGLLAPSLGPSVIIMFFAAICLQAYNGPLSALMQDVVTPRLRARTVALSLLVAHVFGDSISPALVGGISDALGHNLTAALCLTLPPVILAAGVVGLLGLRLVAPDMRAAQQG
jgi:MFS family permease